MAASQEVIQFGWVERVGRSESLEMRGLESAVVASRAKREIDSILAMVRTKGDL